MALINLRLALIRIGLPQYLSYSPGVSNFSYGVQQRVLPRVQPATVKETLDIDRSLATMEKNSYWGEELPIFTW